MDKDELLRIIEQAAKDDVTSLNLFNTGLTMLPREIGQLKELTELDLSNNQLSTLPREIGELTNLKRLNLRYNYLTELPPEIGKLTNLTELGLGYNHLTVLPPEIGNLIKITEIFLRGNQLTALPPEVGKLLELRKLYLGVNQLSTLPPEIGTLLNLAALGLKDNQITQVPREIGKLTNLKGFDLRNNQLNTLPSEIANLSNLYMLDLRGNKFSIPSKILALIHEPAKVITYYLEHHSTKTRDIEDKQRHIIVNNAELLQIIEQAAEINTISLDLSNKGLTMLPPEIEKLPNLTELYLNNNQLTTLPPEIGKLTKLREIDLSRNKFSILPSEIGKLTNLVKIELNYNELSMLPPEIRKLVNLKRLSLSNNQFTNFPPEIAALTDITELYFSYNHFTTIPSEITRLSNLTWLYLRGNQLITFPLEVCELRNLMVLSLGNNQFTILPPEIRKLTNLTELRLDKNKLNMLPIEIGKLTNLIVLNLNDNQLRMLPQDIRKLTNLTEITLKNNPLPIPPEILELIHEPQKILNYYFQHQAEQKKPLNEAKVVIVGQGAVGKTSLVKRLLEDKFDPYETKTEGIDIKRWNITVPSTGSSTSSERTGVRLNVWDFGGQEIMHATHQFFLTKRSLYLLVLDSRLEEQENRVEYWLKIIQSFGGDSPIIVVCNKSDEHDLELNWKGLQEKYPTIKTFAKRVSCKTDEGISDLRTLIEREAGQLDHIHDELLLTWFAVKTRLEQMEEDYISYNEYQKMCATENVSDELSQQTLLGFLHDLGIVLSFHGHYILEDTNVLNPEWVTRGIYQLLNSNELFQRKGVLERKALDHILDSNEYPRSKHQFIIDMMRKFELCFDFAEPAGERFLVPDLLSKEEPYVGEWDDSLAFHYHYDILPGSVISRFIVRMHAYIFKKTYWRNGVVLASEDGKNKALVKADIEDKKIFIYVSGRSETRSRFLAIIRADFRKIHASISKLNVKEVVPLPDHPEVEIDYQDLLKLRERGISTYYYPKADAEINVDQVLDSLETRSTPHEAEREEQQAHSYFLSYSWNNGSEADHIELVLQRNQRTVLRDESYIEAGGRVSKSVEAMIQKADTFVALWSEQYDQSTWCPNELEYARNRQAKGQKPSRIVLIALDETEVPIRFIDSLRLSGQDRGQREQAIQRLLKEEAV